MNICTLVQEKIYIFRRKTRASNPTAGLIRSDGSITERLSLHSANQPLQNSHVYMYLYTCMLYMGQSLQKSHAAEHLLAPQGVLLSLYAPL